MLLAGHHYDVDDDDDDDNYKNNIDDCDDGCDGGVGYRCARGVEREPGLSLKLRGLDAIAAFRFINDMTRQESMYFRARQWLTRVR